MRLLFSQQFCTVVPCRADGTRVAESAQDSCLVQITDDELTIVRAPSAWIDRAPVAEVEVEPEVEAEVDAGVDTAPARSVGSTSLRMNGNRWCVDFGPVRSAEYLRGGGLRARLLTSAGFGRGPSARRAGELNTQFRAVLLERGAIERRGGGAAA